MEQLFAGKIRQHSLLEHPFYLAWNEGTLIRTQLALYSREYGAFIGMISEGWERAGEPAIAKEERGHYTLWGKFTNSASPQEISATLPSTKKLLSQTMQNFQTYAGTLGALYAFEAQQPFTAQSKLAGIRTHYNQWGLDETYFEAHVDDLHEPALLAQKIATLDTEGQISAKNACASQCAALWDALSGIMEGCAG